MTGSVKQEISFSSIHVLFVEHMHVFLHCYKIQASVLFAFTVAFCSTVWDPLEERTQLLQWATELIQIAVISIRDVGSN